MKMNVTDTVKQACGHWPRILPALGMKVIKNRHQACPVCGGADRFRFDDKEGRGTWFCNQCGAGDGLKLVEKVFGISASEAAGKVNAVTGHLPPVAPEVMAAADAGTEAERKAAAALAVRLLEKTRPATGNAYLTRKGFAGRECLTASAAAALRSASVPASAAAVTSGATGGRFPVTAFTFPAASDADMPNTFSTSFRPSPAPH